MDLAIILQQTARILATLTSTELATLTESKIQCAESKVSKHSQSLPVKQPETMYFLSSDDFTPNLTECNIPHS